jgi:hypothetical protein
MHDFVLHCLSDPMRCGENISQCFARIKDFIRVWKGVAPGRSNNFSDSATIYATILAQTLRGREKLKIWTKKAKFFHMIELL